MLTPFLKWVGGKRWLVESGELQLPMEFNTYIEPFLGGGAIFFAVRPDRCILADLNSRLIDVYRVVRDQPVELEALLIKHAQKHSDEYYYLARDSKFDTKLERAAQFLYLNRTCFNGIYRENLKGRFNVPRGTKNSVLLDSDEFLEWSLALNTADLRVSDFEDTIAEAGAGDLVFADPPYTVRHNKNGFVKYNQKIFSWSDQERLAKALRSASERGASFILTNADHEAVRELYRDIGAMRSVGRSSVLAASAENRSRTTELLVTSHNLDVASSLQLPTRAWTQ